ncbi:MAG: PfkB family carbohydrate kinase [Dehalococcoidia bacterium]|nr:PfkB family carbohydrate kinase [Dehalococcoidia bacterium]
MSADACWIIGPVTTDLFERDRRVPGGSVSYAARVAASFGLTARILTAVGPDADLDALAGHEVRVVPGATQTFAHDFPGGRRRLRVVARPGRTLSAADVPASWGAPGTLILAPLLPDDIDLASFLDGWPEVETALLAQGLQRDTDAEGVVRHLGAPAPALLAAARANVTVFLSEEEIEAWPDGALDALARSVRRVVLTRGALGARIMAGGEVVEVPASPADPVDPTGAGDVFATAFILGVRAGDRAAGRLAAAMAAAAVMVRGPAPLPARAAIESRLVAPDPGGVAPDEGPSA